MRVIFLDIDGVLNCWESTRRMKEENRPIKDGYGLLFGPENIEQLLRIVEATDAKIVVSSDWRFSGLTIMRELFEKRGVELDIIGITPKTNYCRGKEIDIWLAHNEVENYVIIDDYNVALRGQSENFVRTSLEFGLTKEVADKAIEILKR